MSYLVGASLFYGFVVTSAKVAIRRIQICDFEWIAVLCLVGLTVVAPPVAVLARLPG